MAAPPRRAARMGLLDIGCADGCRFDGWRLPPSNVAGQAPGDQVEGAWSPGPFDSGVHIFRRHDGCRVMLEGGLASSYHGEGLLGEPEAKRADMATVMVVGGVGGRRYEPDGCQAQGAGSAASMVEGPGARELSAMPKHPIQRGTTPEGVVGRCGSDHWQSPLCCRRSLCCWCCCWVVSAAMMDGERRSKSARERGSSGDRQQQRGWTVGRWPDKAMDGERSRCHSRAGGTCRRTVGRMTLTLSRWES